MVGLSEILATLVMIVISGYLVWTLLGIRQRRMKFAAEGGDDYSGEAKEPEALIKPNEEALYDMDNLLQQAGFTMPEEE
ncbi:MAG: hypothetical protein CMA70_03425 [Euryarchaeota archaeon]|nr:hypothetical protein [Euryarchaeota archaeon]